MYRVALVLLCLTTPAFAIDFTQPLKQLDGSGFVDQNGKPIELDLRKAAESALLASYPDEPNLSGEEKVKRYALAIKIHEHDKLDLTADDIALLKKLIAKNSNPLVTGEAWGMLDPASLK